MDNQDKKWFIFLKTLLIKIKEDEVTAIGAQLTYYLILSLFPFLIFLLNIIGHISIIDENFLKDFLILLPTQTQALIGNIVDEITIGNTGGITSLSLIFALWSASLGLSAIIRAINKAYGIKEKRNFIKQKIVSIIFTVIFVILLIIVLITLVFGEKLGNLVFSYFGATEVFYETWGLLRKLVPIVFMIVIFGLLNKYSIIPSERKNIKFIHTMPGALFTTIGWIVASGIFSFYVNNFADYSRTYGTLGGVIVLLVWLYITSILIVLGGEINGTFASLYF